MSKHKHVTHKPWRDNIEALAMAIVLALLLKAFIVEAYKIPTGSMQPTLMGLDQGPGVPAGVRVSDRILVDKWTYKVDDPERWEVAVFKYPLDRSKNFVKRICGMPGEHFAIRNGDLWRRDGLAEEWQILRRPDDVQRDLWKAVDLADASGRLWVQTSGDGWQLDGGEIEARGDGRARYGATDAPILDRYYHGYPESLRKKLNPLHPRDTNLRVGDLRLEGTVRALPGAEEVAVELREGDARYRFTLPGPAAPEDSRPTIAAQGMASAGTNGADSAGAVAETAGRLPADEAIRFAVENLDDRLRLELDGEVIAELEVAPQPNPDARVFVEARGEGADLGRLRLLRDIHYTPGNKAEEYVIPEGHYLMLGDNTQDSSDSREWTFVRYLPSGATEGEGELLRGNFRQTQNPFQDGAITWLDDEWGERHALSVQGVPKLGSVPEWIDPIPARQVPPETAPFVPRELITGRAIAVFWPINPLKDLYRFKWVR